MLKKITLFSLLIFVFLVIQSCKTKSCWVISSGDHLVIQDTVILESIHYHYKDLEGSPYCIWIDESKLPYVDTLKLYTWKHRKTRSCNCYINQTKL